MPVTHPPSGSRPVADRRPGRNWSVYSSPRSARCVWARRWARKRPHEPAGRWVQLLGRLTCVEGHRARFADDLAESVAFGDARYADIRRPRPRVVARRYQPLSGPSADRT